MSYPLEAKLRPPVEWWAALAFFIASAITFAHPSWLMLSEGLRIYAVAALAAMGFWRLHEGLQVVDYQRNLKALRH